MEDVMNEQTLINAVRKHAMDNYEQDGWDVLVECYDDGDILELISNDNASTVEEAIASVQKTLKIYDDHRAEIRGA
jgi:hypothetical protein